MLPANKKNVPELIKDPVALIQDVRTLIGLHRQDNKEFAVSGKPILILPDSDINKSPGPRGPFAKTTSPVFKGPAKGVVKGPKGTSIDKGGPRRRRTRWVFYAFNGN